MFNTFELKFFQEPKNSTIKEILKNRDIACVIVEPIPANMGLIETHKEFLQGLRKVTEETETILIFDGLWIEKSCKKRYNG